MKCLITKYITKYIRRHIFAWTPFIAKLLSIDLEHAMPKLAINDARPPLALVFTLSCFKSSPKPVSHNFCYVILRLSLFTETSLLLNSLLF